MAETLGPATELDAVNEVLRSVNQGRITSLTGTLPKHADVALDILRSVSRDMQEEGHHFNTTAELDLLVNQDGEIEVPSDTLRVDSTGSTDIAWREGKLFNVEDQTFTFEDAEAVTLVTHLPWASLPQYARRYFTSLACERMIAVYPGADQVTMRMVDRNLARSQAAFVQAELEVGDYNLLTSSSHISTILARGG